MEQRDHRTSGGQRPARSTQQQQLCVAPPSPQCFRDGTWADAVCVALLPPDPPRPRRSELDDATDAQVVVAGVIGSPTSAVAMQRVGLIGSFCDEFSAEELGWLDHPTRLVIGSSAIRYHLGAAIMNLVLVLGVIVLLGLVAAAHWKHRQLRRAQAVVRDDDNPEDMGRDDHLTPSYSRSLVACRSVHLQFVTFAVMVQPTFGSAVLVCAFGTGGEKAAGALVLLVTVLVCLLLPYTLLHKHFRGAFNFIPEKNDDDADDDELLGGAKRVDPVVKCVAGAARYWLQPSGEWVNVPIVPGSSRHQQLRSSAIGSFLASIHDYPELMDPFFMDYRAPFQWFVFVELATSMALSLAASLAAAVRCSFGLPFLMATTTIYFLVLIATRPHAARLDTVVTITFGFTQFAASLVQIVDHYAKSPATRSVLDAAVLSMTVVAYARTVHELLKMVEKLKRSGAKRERAEQASLRGPSAGNELFNPLLVDAGALEDVELIAAEPSRAMEDAVVDELDIDELLLGDLPDAPGVDELDLDAVLEGADADADADAGTVAAAAAAARIDGAVAHEYIAGATDAIVEDVGAVDDAPDALFMEDANEVEDAVDTSTLTDEELKARAAKGLQRLQSLRRVAPEPADANTAKLATAAVVSGVVGDPVASSGSSSSSSASHSSAAASSSSSDSDDGPSQGAAVEALDLLPPASPSAGVADAALDEKFAML